MAGEDEGKVVAEILVAVLALSDSVVMLLDALEVTVALRTEVVIPWAAPRARAAILNAAQDDSLSVSSVLVQNTAP